MDDLLADPVELGAALGVDPSDLKLLAALRAASRRFRDQVRRHISRVVDDVVDLDGNGTVSLLLPNAPVVEVSEVLVDGEAFTAYRFGRRDGRLRRTDGCVWPDLAPVQVTYTHGYDPVPEGIAEVVLDQAKVIREVLPGVQTLTTGGESVTYGAAATVGVTSQWTAAVEHYQLNRGESS